MPTKLVQQRLIPIAVCVVAIGLVYFALDLMTLARTGKVESLAQTQQMVRDLGGTDDQLPIILFRTTWCPACRAAEKFFKEEGISFVAADIEHDQTAARLFRQVTGGRNLGIPQIVIGDEVIGGYSPWHIRRAIAKLPHEDLNAN